MSPVHSVTLLLEALPDTGKTNLFFRPPVRDCPTKALPRFHRRDHPFPDRDLMSKNFSVRQVVDSLGSIKGP
jgi:hypothetical protein